VTVILCFKTNVCTFAVGRHLLQGFGSGSTIFNVWIQIRKKITDSDPGKRGEIAHFHSKSNIFFSEKKNFFNCIRNRIRYFQKAWIRIRKKNNGSETLQILLDGIKQMYLYQNIDTATETINNRCQIFCWTILSNHLFHLDQGLGVLLAPEQFTGRNGLHTWIIFNENINFKACVRFLRVFVNALIFVFD